VLFRNPSSQPSPTLTEALHHLALKNNDKTSSCKASLPALGIFPARQVIFVTLS
jgi:hypothetical protein